MDIYLSSEQAAHALGVRKATLYSYVSRGLIQSFDDMPRRGRKFRRSDIERLARRQTAQRKPRQAARNALDWGLPVLESGLTLIENGKLYYRGVAFADLLPQASLEEVARLLWQCPADADPCLSVLPLSRHWHGAAKEMAQATPFKRMLPLFALGQAELPQQDDFSAAWSLLQLMAACMLGKSHPRLPLHEQCAAAWNLNARGKAVVRTALLCCVDHELNASSFTARCIASTGVDMGSALSGALAALRGPLHGGYTERIETLFDRLSACRSIPHALSALQDDKGNLTGFGHPLYPDGDPRATALLELLPANRTLARIVATARQLSGQAPTIDFALVAARRCLGLPRGTAFGLFALARTVGWIAHFLEQRRTPGLIRPRANYVGPQPQQAAAPLGRIIRPGRNRALPGAR